MKAMMSKLKKKMPMPEDKMPPEHEESESPEYESGEEEGQQEPAEGSEEDMPMNMDDLMAEGEQAPSQLEAIPDEELIAEMKKRGIMDQLDEPSPMEQAPAKKNPFAPKA